jgi:hypothetical protein
MATTPQGKADEARFAQEIAKLAEAIRDLARDSRKPDGGKDVEERRRLQRVDFGYSALGTLMGRVSRGFGGQFDVPVFDAGWHLREPVILLPGLPENVEWIELRNGKRTETVRVRRGRDEQDSPADADAEDSRGGERPPWIHPTTFTPRDAIDSALGLRHQRGPVVALGPRIAPVPSRYA